MLTEIFFGVFQEMAENTRSSAEVWLLGKGMNKLSNARLPTCSDVLRLVQYHHHSEAQTLRKSYNIACEEVLKVWERARIPTQRIDSCVRKLTRLYEEYITLKKNRKTQLQSCRSKEHSFQENIKKLFDIASKDVLNKMRNEEDRKFLLMQRENVFSCSMLGSDMITFGKESRKKIREQKAMQHNEKVYTQNESGPSALDDLESVDSSSLSEEDLNETDKEYQPPLTKQDAFSSNTPKLSNLFQNPGVVEALDRVNISDRGAAMVAGSLVQAMGQDISSMTFSRSSIRRSRRQVRVAMGSDDKASFSVGGPILLHWDGKLLPSIDNSRETEERIAIIISGNGMEKLLGVPKIQRPTGEEQAMACISTLDDWKLRDNVQGIVFDTTASNTGLQKGACTIIEKTLGRELVWIACRHHVLEIILANACKHLLGPSGGPKSKLFERFKDTWPSIQKDSFVKAKNILFDNSEILTHLRGEMVPYLMDALKSQHIRHDYEELLRLSLIFLGHVDKSEIKFRAPGATHHARWMAKAIYILKIYMFKHQFNLTEREHTNITECSLFIALVYARFWNEVHLGINAPFNDIMLLQILEKYPNETICKEVTTALRRHLWYLGEHLVGLAFFDERIEVETKKKMVQNLECHGSPTAVRRLNLTKNIKDLGLNELITERTKRIFDLLIRDGFELAKNSFLETDPNTWEDNKMFQEFKRRAINVKVVNDPAERGIALIKAYNTSLTKDEEQKQLLLKLVANHRKKIPTFSKEALANQQF